MSIWESWKNQSESWKSAGNFSENRTNPVLKYGSGPIKLPGLKKGAPGSKTSDGGFTGLLEGTLLTVYNWSEMQKDALGNGNETGGHISFLLTCEITMVFDIKPKI